MNIRHAYFSCRQLKLDKYFLKINNYTEIGREGFSLLASLRNPPSIVTIFHNIQNYFLNMLKLIFSYNNAFIFRILKYTQVPNMILQYATIL